jgi:hypothetical protein
MNDILDIFENGLNQAGQIGSELLSQMGDLKITVMQYGKFLGILIFGILLITSLTRFLFGKKNQINLAVTSAMEILCVYVINVVIYALGLHLQQFITPLPFVTMVEDYLILYPILSAEFVDICHHVLKLLIIAFLVNLINEIIPEGKHLITWFLLRLITVAIAVAAIYFAELGLNTFVPQGIYDIAPTVLLCCLVALVLLGSLKVLVGAVMAFLDPVIAALYTFFFSNVIGRALAKAMVSTALLTGLVAALDYLNITVVLIAASALSAYLPLLLIVVALWYIVGRIL